MFEKELKNLGLSEKEAKVYLAALQLGADTVQNISKKSGINRPTTYVQIEALKRRGLMSEVERGKKTYFNAEPPDRLESLLNTFEKELNFKKDEIKRVMPQLFDLFIGASSGRPKVRFFEGPADTRAMHDDFLKTKDKKIENIVNLDDLFHIYPKHEAEFTRKRVEKGIKTFAIYTRAAGPLPSATSEAHLRVAKYLPPEKFPINADITIYGDKVAMATYKEKGIGVIIESQEIANTLRGMFYLIWGRL